MSSLLLFITAATGLMGGESAELSVEGLYFGARRPVPVTVKEARSSALTLVLMDADGLLKARPLAVLPGRIDLSEAMPAIRGLRHACYLQLLEDERPVGPALVVQPMLSRLVPIVESRAGAGPGSSVGGRRGSRRPSRVHLSRPQAARRRTPTPSAQLIAAYSAAFASIAIAT